MRQTLKLVPSEPVTVQDPPTLALLLWMISFSDFSSSKLVSVIVSWASLSVNTRVSICVLASSYVNDPVFPQVNPLPKTLGAVPSIACIVWSGIVTALCVIKIINQKID